MAAGLRIHVQDFVSMHMSFCELFREIARKYAECEEIRAILLFQNKKE
jgi:hypothetical protein